jgi:hypothetical protein
LLVMAPLGVVIGGAVTAEGREHVGR